MHVVEIVPLYSVHTPAVPSVRSDSGRNASARITRTSLEQCCRTRPTMSDLACSSLYGPRRDAPRTVQPLRPSSPTSDAQLTMLPVQAMPHWAELATAPAMAGSLWQQLLVFHCNARDDMHVCWLWKAVSGSTLAPLDMAISALLQRPEIDGLIRQHGVDAVVETVMKSIIQLGDLLCVAEPEALQAWCLWAAGLLWRARSLQKLQVRAHSCAISLPCYYRAAGLTSLHMSVQGGGACDMMPPLNAPVSDTSSSTAATFSPGHMLHDVWPPRDSGVQPSLPQFEQWDERSNPYFGMADDEEARDAQVLHLLRGHRVCLASAACNSGPASDELPLRMPARGCHRAAPSRRVGCRGLAASNW